MVRSRPRLLRLLAVAMAAALLSASLGAGPALAGRFPVRPWSPGQLWTPASDVRSPSGLAAWSIDAYLAAATPLPPLGHEFMAAERTHHVNARVLLAIAMLESGHGRSDLARYKHNLFGWNAADRGPYRLGTSFSSYAEGVDTVAAQLAARYLDPSGPLYIAPTLAGINVYYAGASHWATTISDIVNTMWLPTFGGAGIAFGAPILGRPAAAGVDLPLSVPVTIPVGAHFPVGLRLGYSWRPAPGTVSATSTPGSGAVYAHEVVADGPPDHSIAADTSAAPAGWTNVLRLVEGGLGASIPTPAVPGDYTLALRLLDTDGEPLPPNDDPQLPALAVRVYGPWAAAYEVTSPGGLVAGGTSQLALTVWNAGSHSWRIPSRHSVQDPPTGATRLVVRWVASDTGLEIPAATALVPLDSGNCLTLTLPLVVPTRIGPYVLAIDVFVPDVGSLASAGVPGPATPLWIGLPGTPPTNPARAR